MFKKIDNVLVEYEYLKSKSNKNCIVFLHGFGGNLNNFSYFAKIFNNFGYSTLNINLTDFGFKTLPKFFNIYDYANVVYKLIKALKIENFSLIGHSFGGRIALILAGQYKCVNKLILVDSAGLKPKFSLKTKTKILKYKVYKRLANKNIINKEKLKKFGSTDYKTLNFNLKVVFKNVINEDLSYLLTKIKNNTLIIFGKNDKDTPIYMAKKLHKNIKNSKLVIFQNAAHYSYLNESQKFINIVKNFLGENE